MTSKNTVLRNANETLEEEKREAEEKFEEERKKARQEKEQILERLRDAEERAAGRRAEYDKDTETPGVSEELAHLKLLLNFSNAESADEFITDKGLLPKIKLVQRVPEEKLQKVFLPPKKEGGAPTPIPRTWKQAELKSLGLADHEISDGWTIVVHATWNDEYWDAARNAPEEFNGGFHSLRD